MARKKELGYHARTTLFLLLGYIFFMMVLIAVFRPLIIANFESGGYRQKAALYFNTLRKEEKDTYSCALYSIDGPVIRSLEVNKGFTDDRHMMIEALLGGPDDENLAEGLITYIPERTRLIGISEKNNICFVSLSERFLDSPDIDKAVTQIKKTLNNAYPHLRVAVMVGKEIIG